MLNARLFVTLRNELITILVTTHHMKKSLEMLIEHWKEHLNDLIPRIGSHDIERNGQMF